MVLTSATMPGLRRGTPLLATLLFAGAAALSASPTAAQEPFLLPDHPPDSVPADLYDNYDRDYAAPMDVFIIIFPAGLSRERKTELVVAVGAVELAGGRPMKSELMDGQYFIRVESDGTIQPLLRAISALTDHPDVVSVGIITPVGHGGQALLK